MKKNLDYCGLFKPDSNWYKFILTMKISAFLLFCCLVNIIAAPTYSQVTKISLSLKDATIEEVLNKIEDQSEFYFLYNQKLIDVTRKVNIEADKKPIADILHNIFDRDTKFVVYDRQIILTPSYLTVPSAAMQQLKITGIVTTKDGAPLPGANVVITGKTLGTVTDIAGKYSIDIPQGARSLTFSFIGMESQEINIGTSTQINVTMVESAVGLKEIVVTGVGVATSKKNLAFSVEAISAKELPSAPTASIDQSLVGKIPGAQISTINGTPGAGMNILLRGINSLSRGTSPMILLDGIQVSATDLNSLDLSTIDRVEVVQGAASATIYGAQGANGVIQLFTKKGLRTGKINIDISSSYADNAYLNIGGLSKAKLHGFNTDGQNNVVDGNGNPLVFDPEAGYTHNLIWLSTDPTVQANKPYNANLKYYDHFKMLFQASPTTNNAITFSGGTDKLDIALTLSNNHQVSNIRTNGYLDRTNLTSNIGITLAKNLNFRSITQLVSTRSTMKFIGIGGVIMDMIMSRPFANYDYLDPDGNHVIYFGNAVGNIGGNFRYDQQYRDVKDKKSDLVQTFDLNYKPTRFLELDAKYGINYQKMDNEMAFKDQTQNKSVQYYGFWLSSQNNDDATGEFLSSLGTTTFQNLTATATVHLDFQKDFNLNIPLISITQAGYDFRKNDAVSFDVSGIGLPAYTPFTKADARSYRVLDNTTTLFTTYGYLVTQRFEYGSFGGISGGFRSDYSSAFGAGSRPFTFPRGDAYIRPSSFNFWSALKKVLPEFKIRAAYGEAGIQPGPYDRYVTLVPTQLAGKVVFTTPTTSTNPDLSVEVSKEFEIGSDMTFNISNANWLKRIDFSVSFWKRTTDNSIWPLDVASSTGLGSVLNNSFGLKSQGWQASLNLPVLTGKNFTWNFTANFSNQASEITSVKNNQAIAVTSSTGSAGYVLKPGYKIGQLYGYLGLHDVNAIDPNTGQPFIPVAQQSNYEVASNGWVVGSATKLPYFTSTKYSFGDPNPKFNASFINDVTYKNFISFSMQWDWINGSHLYNETKEWMYRDGIHSDIDKPITINGQTGAWSAFYRGCYAQVERNGTKSIFYENASFARLRNIAVAVDFARMFNLKSIRKLQLVLSGRNLITLTKYTGMDPEISSGPANSAYDRGVDCASMPNLRTYQVGINVGF